MVQMDPTIAIGVLAVVIGGVVVASLMSNNGGQLGSSMLDQNSGALEEQIVVPEKVDVTIPYDAAARLAYDEWRQKNGMMDDDATTTTSDDFDEQCYASFKIKYETMTVANVIAKRMERELMAMVPEKTKPPSP